jgi:phage baseplate assembly protein V
MRRFPGVVIGIVTDLDDPAEQGRIRLSFPWMGEQKSAWAPVAAPLAGKARGQWFMPEVGDEALVAFEHGDFAHPFVLGYLWNGADAPPSTDPQERIIVTPGGHELRFHDKDGSKQVVLKTSAGFTVKLDDAAKSITLETPGQISVKLDDMTSSLTLSGGGRSLTLMGGQVQIA